MRLAIICQHSTTNRQSCIFSDIAVFASVSRQPDLENPCSTSTLPCDRERQVLITMETLVYFGPLSGCLSCMKWFQYFSILTPSLTPFKDFPVLTAQVSTHPSICHFLLTMEMHHTEFFGNYIVGGSVLLVFVLLQVAGMLTVSAIPIKWVELWKLCALLTQYMVTRLWWRMWQ